MKIGRRIGFGGQLFHGRMSSLSSWIVIPNIRAQVLTMMILVCCLLWCCLLQSFVTRFRSSSIISDNVEGLQLAEVQSLQRGESEFTGESSRLNSARPRDPDAYPPSNALELFGTWIFKIGTAFSHGNLLFAVKAAVLVSQWPCLPPIIQFGDRRWLHTLFSFLPYSLSHDVDY